MAKIIRVIGYKAFKKAIEAYNEKSLLYCYFSGSSTEKGQSWCEHCVVAEPRVYAALKKYAQENTIFVHAEVGFPDEFLNDNNPFKLDPDVQLSLIPTLQRWKCGWQLLGGNCSNEELLKRFFTKRIDH